MSESELYAPVKSFLERQGYLVKGEIGDCDVFAVRGKEPPVIVELKQSFNLALLLQAVDRLPITDAVYIAFRIGKGQSARWRSRRRKVLGLLRRLGLGLLTVSSTNKVNPVLDPVPYHPRASVRRQARLLREFEERVGDPEVGGSSARRRLTAYRQDALRCARELAQRGVLKASVLRDWTGVQRAGALLRDNHYGWFERVSLGHYTLSPKGHQELQSWSHAELSSKSESDICL